MSKINIGSNFKKFSINEYVIKQCVAFDFDNFYATDMSVHEFFRLTKIAGFGGTMRAVKEYLRHHKIRIPELCEAIIARGYNVFHRISGPCYKWIRYECPKEKEEVCYENFSDLNFRDKSDSQDED